MKYNMFSIYDEKAKAYLPPFILPEVGMAIRTFSDCINSRDHQFSKHPKDYTLFKIANFNDDNGHIDQQKEPIGNGIEYKIFEEKNDLFPESVINSEQEQKNGSQT